MLCYFIPFIIKNTWTTLYVNYIDSKSYWPGFIPLSEPTYKNVLLCLKEFHVWLCGGWKEIANICCCVLSKLIVCQKNWGAMRQNDQKASNKSRFWSLSIAQYQLERFPLQKQIEHTTFVCVNICEGKPVPSAFRAAVPNRGFSDPWGQKQDFRGSEMRFSGMRVWMYFFSKQPRFMKACKCYFCAFL